MGAGSARGSRRTGTRDRDELDLQGPGMEARAHAASSPGRNPGATLSAFPRRTRLLPLQGEPIRSPGKAWKLGGILAPQSSFLSILSRQREKPKGSKIRN